MGTTDTIVTILTQAQRFATIVLAIIPALFGLFMVLWGIFINDGDWSLIGVGLAIFLICGWGTYRIIVGNNS